MSRHSALALVALRLERLAPGSYRRLTHAEVAALYRAVGL